ncbi:MAG TPA: response regulator [Spirochaetes bacterium]|nr:response regulator [Spirochaetota bacterium]
MKIRYKLTALFLLIIIASLIPASLFILRRVESHLMDRLLLKARIDAEVLARSTVHTIMMNGGDVATSRVDSRETISILEPFISQGMVYADAILLAADGGRDGLVLASLRDRSLPDGLLPEKEKLEAPELERLREITKGCTETSVRPLEGGYYEIVAPGGLQGMPAFCLGRLVYSGRVMLAPMRAINRMIIIVTACALIAAAALGMLFSRVVSRPVEELIGGARRFEAGELDGEVAVRSSDELGLLAASFNRMALALRLKIAELEAANIELSRMNELKDEFLANTSHELRTPITGIVGIAESLMDGAAGPLDEAALRNLSMIVTSGRRLAHLVNDILDFSRLKHGAMELSYAPVDMHAITQLVMSIMGPIAGKKNLALKNLIEPGAVIVRGDENRLQQIVLNLLDNAIKFTDRGEISVSAETPDGATAVISVDDTGIGIPADKLDRIFISFEQADGSVSRRYGGAGLGLAITKQLVELHGGLIRAESEPGKGARFRFTLPRYDLPSDGAFENAPGPGPDAAGFPRPFAAADVPGPVSAPLTPGEGEKILIIDDEPVNLQVLINFLGLAGYRVDVAHSGPEGLRLIEESVPDAVLLDVMMPVMSGYEVCRVLREKYSRHELPVLMLTAKRSIDDMVTGFQCGASDYIPKPFNRDELLARVSNLIAIKKAAADHNRLAVLNRELTIAHQIQQSILPACPPKLPGMTVETCYRPASVLGGDFYDFLEAGDNCLGALMADVSGHGIPAAIISAMFKMAFSMHRGDCADPGMLLAGTESALRGKLHGQFITACYARIDPARMTMATANAGHWAPLVCSGENGDVYEVQARGRAMGPLPGAGFPVVETALVRGDRVVLYTDGIIECRDPAGAMFGEERFHRLIREGRALPPGEFINRVLDAVAAWSGLPGSANQEDDITMVVVDMA